MIRGKIWFRCAVVHDPVCPRIINPALIGWEAKNRKIDLVIERSFKGDELVSRMKGWITVDTAKVIETVNKHGRLKVLDDAELFVEADTTDDFTAMQNDIRDSFGDEVNIELIGKK